MKKIMVIAMTALMLSACGAENSDRSSKADTTTTEATTTTATTVAEKTSSAVESVTDSNTEKKSFIVSRTKETVDDNDNEWEITDETKLDEITQAIDEINDIKDDYIFEYENDGEQGASGGYILKMNGDTYEDMYFITTKGSKGSNFANNHIDYNLPQENIDKLVSLIEQ